MYLSYDPNVNSSKTYTIMQSNFCISERNTLSLQPNKVRFIWIGVSPVGKGLPSATLFYYSFGNTFMPYILPST